MIREQTRRNVMVAAAAFAGASLAMTAMAQTAPATAKTEYMPKKLPFDPAKVKGLSERLLVSHYETTTPARLSG